MRGSWKIVAYGFAGLVAVLVLLLATVLILANTEAGRQFIARETGDLTHGRVRLSGLHGSFPESVDLDRLELSDARGPWLWAEHLSLRWSPSALLARHVEVEALHVAVLHVERAPISENAKTSSSSSVPHTDVRDLDIGALELGKALVGTPVALSVKGSAQVRSLQAADVTLNARRIAGDGTYALEAHLDPRSLDANLQLHEPAGGPLAHLVGIPQAGALSVAASLKGPRTAVDLKLTADAGPAQARVSGRIDLRDPAAALSYSFVAPQMSPAAGLGWDRIELQGQLNGALAKLSTQGHLLIRNLQAPGGVRLSQLQAEVKGDRGSVALQADVDGLEIPGRAPGLFAASRLTLAAGVRLDEAQRPLQLTAHHPLFDLTVKAVTAGRQSADLALRVPNLAPFGAFSGPGLSGDAQVAAHVDYTPAASSLTADVTAHVDGGEAAWAGLVRGGATQLKTTVDMTDDEVTLRSLTLAGRALSLEAQGRAARNGDGEVHAQFSLALPDLHRASPALAGDLKATGTVAGPRGQLSVDTRLTTTVSVRGSPQGTVSAHLLAKDLPQSPQGTLDASGQLDGAPLRLTAQLQTPSQGVYRATITRADWKSLVAQADVSADQSFTNAHGGARLRLGQLADFSRLAGRPLAGSLSADLAFTSPGGRPRVKLDFQAKQIVAGGLTANAQLHATGPLDAVEARLQADSPSIAGQAARVSAATILNLGRRELQLSSLDTSYRNQHLRLLRPATFEFAHGFAVRHLQLGVQAATVDVDGQISPSLDVKADVKQVDAALIDAFAPNLLASGTLAANATIRGTAAAPTGTVQVRALNVRAQGNAFQGLPATNLRADARLEGSTARVDAHLSAGGSQLALTGQVPLSAGGAVDAKLSGNVDLALANPILEAGGRHVTGAVAIDTSVTGHTEAPKIVGTVHLTNGSVRDYGQGISLTAISGELTGSQDLLRIEKLTAHAAPGDISVQGTIGVLQPKIPVDLTVTARNAQPIDSNIVTANLNADLRITGTAREQLGIDGTVHLNKTVISIPGGLPPEVAVLDVERDGPLPPTPQALPLVIDLHLDVEAPRQFLINGRGLDAEMGGTLHVRGTTAAPIVNGGFELQRGSFNLANSRLNITSGTVTFNGTGLQKRLDPSLDFTAQTQAAEVTAIVHITGLADAPHLELTSTPELPSDEILSRLLFGEPAAQLTALQLVQTGAALASLRGGSNGPSLNPLTRIQKALGLDRLSVGSAASTSGTSTSTAPAGASVAAGRYVSNRVYVGVKQSTTGSSQVDVDVDLTKNLKLQAQLGNGTATAQGTTPDTDPGSVLGLSYQVDY